MTTWQVRSSVFVLICGTFIIVLYSVLVNKKMEGGGFLQSLSKFSNFGLCVKTELLKKGKTQKWLEEAVAKKTGLFVDSGYMYKILTGKRNAPNIVDAICEVLEITNPTKETE